MTLSRRGAIPASAVDYAQRKLAWHVKRCGITKAQLREGMAVEREHQDVTHGSIEKTARIAVAHLCERKDYYKLLKKYVETSLGHVRESTRGPAFALSGLGSFEQVEVPQFIVRDGDIQVRAPYWTEWFEGDGASSRRRLGVDDSGYLSDRVRLVVTPTRRNQVSILLWSPMLQEPAHAEDDPSGLAFGAEIGLTYAPETELVFTTASDDSPVAQDLVIYIDLSPGARAAWRIYMDLLRERGFVTDV